MRTRRARVGVSTLMGLLIGVVITIVIGLVAYLAISGFFSGSSVPASLQITAGGSVTSFGAIVEVTMRNGGTNPANVVAVLVAGGGATDASLVDTSLPIQTGVVNDMPRISDYPNGNGLAVGGGKTKSVQLKVSGVHEGSTLTIFVVYYDTVTGEGKIAQAQVTLT